MKNCILKLLCLALLLGGALSASAVNVTFSVNMGIQRDMNSFDSATDFVFVAGDPLNGWSQNTTMLTQSLTDTNVWEVTVNLTAGTYPNYKFVKQRFGIGFVWEVDGVGPNGDQNRWFQVPASDTNLAVVFFNNITNVVANHAPVTFRVDMSVQIAQGAFNPGTGTLAVSGDAIDDWANAGTHFLTQSLANTNLWVGTFEITNGVGSTALYKFIMDGTWETSANRSFTMTNVAQTLPVVYFNNVASATVPIPLTFSVNMGVALARGTFNPGGGDFLEARGSFFADTGGAWLGGFTLTNSPANPVVFSGTHTTTNGTGGTVLYQFVINGSTWENSGNRTHVLANTNAVTLPTAFLNNVATLGPLTNTPISATSAALSWSGGPLIRLQNSAYLNGPWLDVPDTQGQSSTNLTVGPDQTYFRLIGP